MTLTLTAEQAQAVTDRADEPIRLIHPNGGQVFVLVRADDYDRIRPLLEDEFDIRETYTAQFTAALRAGWDDPAMDAYDNYDEAYKKLCQSTEDQSS